MYKKGIYVGIGGYALIAIIVSIYHFFFDTSYAHAPPASFFVFVILLFGALCFAIYNWINTLSLTKGKFHKGAFLVHKIVFGGILTFVILLSLIARFVF